MEYAVDIYAGPRLAYATAGWGVYLDHPVTGVGLGASGLYLYDHIPDWSITTISEITRQLTPNGWLYPNPKNLYIRLLAETGITGFILYLLFWLGILAVVIRLSKSGSQLQKMLGGQWSIHLAGFDLLQFHPGFFHRSQPMAGIWVYCWAYSLPDGQ